MVEVDTLSDAELRTKLIEYGFPVMPITGTTRKVMVKKLKLLMEKGPAKTTSDRRSLAQFSSEEESDADVKPVKKDKRRATMAVPPMQPPSSTKVSSRKSRSRAEENDVIDDAVKLSTSREEKKTTRATKIMNLINDKDLDTNSDSEPDIVETDYKISPRNNFTKKDSPIKSAISSTYVFSSTSSKNYSPPKQTDASVRGVTSTYSSPSPSRYSTYNSPSIDASDKLNQIRSRLSLGNNYDTFATPSESVAEPGHTPFLSNFTKRLSQLSANKTEYDVKTDVIKEHDSNGSGTYSRTYLSRPKQREYSRDYHANQEGNSKGNYISFLLVGGVLLFFVVLTALYWGLHSGNNNNEILGLVVPYCSEQATPKMGKNCIIEDDVQGAVDIYRVIKPKLIKMAIEHLCNDAKAKPFMTEDDVIGFVKANYALQDNFAILQDLNNFVILLFKNTFWEVSVLQSNNEMITDRNTIGTLDEVMQNKENGYKLALAVLNPSLPFACSMYLKFSAALKTILLILGISGVFYAGKYGYKNYRHHQQRNKDEIVLMVERILDILQTHASEDSDNYLVINHVRDMILPIDNRKKMERTWSEAVNFINENESRVRTEVQVVKGEPYEVWRWLGGLNTSAARNKSWQGQAFETQVGSVNSPPCSPTPCLKIRGMVDDGDRNLHTIKEAVLVKCADQCRILHCSVDVNSKCVYLKCADQNDAAIAYRNLHGWWYASHLVTVKYLRLERYMQRFPESPASGPPFLKAHQPTMEWSK